MMIKKTMLFSFIFLLGYSQSEAQNEGNIDSKKQEIWRNYKFIPGDKVIFYDDLKNEEVGEFPSRWDLLSGGSEVIKFNGENVIMGTTKYDNKIIPLFSTENYLPEQFTIEFDVYIDELSKELSSSRVNLTLFFVANRSEEIVLFLHVNRISGKLRSNNDLRIEDTPLGKLNAWHHISMSYNKGKFKMYYDETRILNIPRFSVVPNRFELEMDTGTDHKAARKIIPLIKNIKVAEGGESPYKSIIADGKFVTHGILFDSGKAILKSQSFGVINKLVGDMNDNADWKFEIIGHTDSDGEEESNLALSQRRADAVKRAMINVGIDASRFTTSGMGESAPLNQNKSPEEKANNRRVEFVLKK